METDNIQEVKEQKDTDNLIQNRTSGLVDSGDSQADKISESPLVTDNNINKKESGENKMRQVEIEKMVLNCGGIDDKLEKSVKLLQMIVKGRKIYKVQATKRLPAFGISPGKVAGCKVTIRDKEQIKDLLKRFFAALDNEIKKKQIVENHLSLGIHEYIEVPGTEYDRDIGILGFEVDIVFARKGKRVKVRKVKRGQLPRKQWVSREEIIEYLNKNFGVEVQ